jgi:hypothetical protein
MRADGRLHGKPAGAGATHVTRAAAEQVRGAWQCEAGRSRLSGDSGLARSDLA